MTVIQQIKNAVGNVIETYFSSDLDVMSHEAKRIMSNPEDKKKYLEAVEKLKNPEQKEITITLSNREEITLI